MRSPTTRRRQRGISLIESLVALLVAALGILGVVGVQMRTLADTQTGVRRAQAVRLIEDLGERMRVNPNALVSIASYASAFETSPTVTSCASGCDRDELAAYDVAIWKQAVKQQLPSGDAEIFLAADETVAANRRLLGVMVAWRENERADRTEDTTGTYLTAIDASAGGGTVTCKVNHTCHLQYIPVGARCTSYGPISSPRFFCP